MAILLSLLGILLASAAGVFIGLLLYEDWYLQGVEVVLIVVLVVLVASGVWVFGCTVARSRGVGRFTGHLLIWIGIVMGIGFVVTAFQSASAVQGDWALPVTLMVGGVMEFALGIGLVRYFKSILVIILPLYCPRCQQTIKPEEATITCPECKTTHHIDCWQWYGGCATPGCGQAPEAKCPVCRSVFTDNDDTIKCPECGARHHKDCWERNGGCGAPKCPVCRHCFAPGDEAIICPGCGVKHHKDCWDLLGGCSTFACPRAPAIR